MEVEFVPWLILLFDGQWFPVRGFVSWYLKQLLIVSTVKYNYVCLTLSHALRYPDNVVFIAEDWNYEVTDPGTEMIWIYRWWFANISSL